MKQLTAKQKEQLEQMDLRAVLDYVAGKDREGSFPLIFYSDGMYHFRINNTEIDSTSIVDLANLLILAIFREESLELHKARPTGEEAGRIAQRTAFPASFHRPTNPEQPEVVPGNLGVPDKLDPAESERVAEELAKDPPPGIKRDSIPAPTPS